MVPYFVGWSICAETGRRPCPLESTLPSCMTVQVSGLSPLTPKRLSRHLRTLSYASHESRDQFDELPDRLLPAEPSASMPLTSVGAGHDSSSTLGLGCPSPSPRLSLFTSYTWTTTNVSVVHPNPTPQRIRNEARLVFSYSPMAGFR
ncbi:unnamed protein product [Schistocephalus solidus]|uniref:Uncharacterized protein n=1 Tax=Schistocephalus solidus TaxID=70667 RepID=A0A183SJP2_SCHSO|nr:unnamed protein product [Schistocephalus solidus]